MYSYLVHPTSSGLAEHDAGPAIVTKSLEVRMTIFSIARDFAHAYLVGHHFDRLLTRHMLPVMIHNKRV